MDPYTVTRVELNTQLESRVTYMKSFLEWTNDDSEIMKEVKPIAKPLVPEIVASAYGCQGTHGTTDDLVGAVDRITIDSASIKIRRNILEKWALKIFTSDYEEMEIFEFFDRIGMQHVGGARVFSLGTKKPLFVDYIHLAMTLGYITDRMTAAILSLPSSTWSIEKKTRAVRAFHKIAWIHNDLLARHHTQEACVSDPALSPLCSPGVVNPPTRRGSNLNPFSPGLACPMTDESCQSDPPTLGYNESMTASNFKKLYNSSGSEGVSSHGSSNQKASDSSLTSVAPDSRAPQDSSFPFARLSAAPLSDDVGRSDCKSDSSSNLYSWFTVAKTDIGSRN